MAENDSKAVTVWLPGQLAREVEGVASKRGMSRSALLAFILDRSLSGRAEQVYEDLVASADEGGHA